ncbi:MAG: hypothetical protein D6782_04635 [Alphaproteobacteria bacterium]|nr:MAG: hypothetical protein D6782_04635 [Alphaproteobacteria bacterium]
MGIFSAVFGDPQAQQAQVSAQFQAAVARLQQARKTGNRPAELAALADMRRLSAQGKAITGKHLAVVAAGDAVGQAAGSVGHAVGNILTSKPVLIVAAAVAGVYLLGKAVD